MIDKLCYQVYKLIFIRQSIQPTLRKTCHMTHVHNTTRTWIVIRFPLAASESADVIDEIVWLIKLIGWLTFIKLKQNLL